ncbi:MAG: transglutaminase, partial [Mesorhizobium sp.]
KGPPVELTRKLWATIIDINNSVNARVKPRTDMEIYGVEEYWAYPDNGVGDCEDYALEKRRELMAAGVPAGNLLMTVVRQPNGDGHAVLTVRTGLGEFILDNLEPKVLAWNDTVYTYLKRQSTENSGVWVTINDGREDAVA